MIFELGLMLARAGLGGGTTDAIGVDDGELVGVGLMDEVVNGLLGGADGERVGLNAFGKLALLVLIT